MVVIAFFMAKNSDTHDLLSRVNIFQIQAHLKNHPQLSKSYLGIIIFMCESRNVNEDKIESLKQWVKETESALPDLKMFCTAALSGLDQVTKDINDGIVPTISFFHIKANVKKSIWNQEILHRIKILLSKKHRKLYYVIFGIADQKSVS